MHFVKAQAANYDDYFELRCDENNVLWSGHKHAPEYKKLKDWYVQNIQRTDRLFFLAYENELQKNCIGYLYMDIVGDKKDTVEIGYGVHFNFNGKGYGTKIIAFATDFVTRKMPQINIVQGWIGQSNLGSIKIFVKNGFIKSDKKKYITLKRTGENILFEEYLYFINR